MGLCATGWGPNLLHATGVRIIISMQPLQPRLGLEATFLRRCGKTLFYLAHQCEPEVDERGPPARTKSSLLF